MKSVISVENLGKKYVLGHRSSALSPNLREELTEYFSGIGRNILRPFGRADRQRHRRSVEEFWALNDVSFTVREGECLGIIGRNGAGKSTLLKILSRITEPTTGAATIRGRVASLLEVGTGFHPDLTGRENIFLNGAILGMHRSEIIRKFDEIVSFAEVERFLDTPIKHYSSGMNVRLAFAVAAHLEPEVLIIDEVLAVGDTHFQKKCLGKMEDVTQEGRTVLFVSHNMATIRSFCSRAILLRGGVLHFDGAVDAAIGGYLAENEASTAVCEWDVNSGPRTEEMRLIRAYIINDEGELSSHLDCMKPFSIVVEYEVFEPVRELRIGFFLQSIEGVPLCGSNDPDGWRREFRNPGLYRSVCHFPGYILNGGTYLVNFGVDKYPHLSLQIDTPFVLSFSIEDTEGHGPRKERLPGVVRPKLFWEVNTFGE